MTLFLSSAFLRRLALLWKSDLKAFLIGDRNLMFFIPDSAVEISEITPETINDFLQRSADGPWEFLGFLSPSEVEFETYHLQIITSGSPDPAHWKAHIPVPVSGELPGGMKNMPMEILIATS